jgi:hypothetical protein
MSEVFQWTTAGEVVNIDLVRSTWSTWKVDLFVNNHTPVPGDTSPGTFTLPTWTGYAQQTLGTLTAAALSGNIAYTDSLVLSFPVTSGSSGQVVYGHAVKNAGDTVVMFADLFASPITPVDGLPVQVQVRLRFKNP